MAKKRTGPKPDIADAQSHIEGRNIARMLTEFKAEYRGIYPEYKMIDTFTAVGPMHTFIGWAVKNGYLQTPDQTEKPVVEPPKKKWWFW